VFNVLHEFGMVARWRAKAKTQCGRCVVCVQRVTNVHGQRAKKL
jgi:hypothetical protein